MTTKRSMVAGSSTVLPRISVTIRLPSGSAGAVSADAPVHQQEKARVRRQTMSRVSTMGLCYESYWIVGR